MENVSLILRRNFTMDKFLTEIKVVADQNIKRVLSFKARSVVVSKEIIGGVVSVSGKVAVNMICLGENNEIFSTTNEIDFSEKQKAVAVLTDLFARDTVEVKLSTVAGSEALFVVSHKVNICGSFDHKFLAVSGDSDFVVKRKNFTSNSLSKVVDESFVVAEECDTNLGDVSILLATAETNKYSVVASVDRVVIEGSVLAEVVYTENESFSSMKKEIEFKQEVAIDGVLPNMNANANLNVLNITVTPENKDGKTTLVFAIDIQVQAQVYDEYEIEAVCDMFSLQNELKTTFELSCIKNYQRSICGSETIVSSTEIAHITDLEDFVGVYGAEFVVQEIKQLSEKVVVCGEIQANAVYCTQSEKDSMRVVKNVEFEILNENNQKFENFKVFAAVESFKVKAGKELETVFVVDYIADIVSVVEEEFVTNFEIKEERVNKFSGIKVYITKEGETLFDVARVIGVKPEVIETQNEIGDFFRQGEKIYVYSPINLM